MDIRRRIAATVREHAMIAQQDVVLLAVSGGADSMAMLHLLVSMRGVELPSFEAHVAHLNHRLRGRAADEDAEFVRDQAAPLGLHLHLEAADVPLLARTLHSGVEEAGRQARYGFFRRVADSIGARAVATAHQADDNVETVLMRVARGMTLRALGGIPPVRPLGPGCRARVIRPLLDCRRDEIEAFLSQRHLPWRRDPTNLDPEHLRNRIRHRVLPRLEGALVPGITESILAGIEHFRRARRTLAAQADRALGEAPIEESAARVRFSASWLGSLPTMLACEILHRFFARLVRDPGTLTAAHHKAVLALCRRSPAPEEIALPEGVVARRQGDECLITRKERAAPAPPPPGTTRLDLADGETELPGFGGRMSIRVREGGPADLRDFLERRTPLTALFDADRLRGALSVRAWRPGDRMEPLGAPGTRKVQDIFTDRKVARPERIRTPILALADEPIWVVGCDIAESVKVGPETLRLAEFVFRRG